MHKAQNSHEFDFNDVKIIDCCSQWSYRLFLEAWHSTSEPNSINDHIHIPDIKSWPIPGGSHLLQKHLITSWTPFLIC